jgi:serine/threonine-protein kinase 24/25/MST4
VAIKVIDLEETNEDIDVIRREISMMAQSSSCPQMTRYFSSQVVGSNLEIAMEYMGGGAVSDLVRLAVVSKSLVVSIFQVHFVQLKDAALEEPLIQVIAREVLLGLKYLHGEGKIHRDIKGMTALLALPT